VILALLLASALAGPPPPIDHAALHREIARTADGIAADIAWIGLGASADLLSTSAALRWCPECGEGNPIGWDTEARVALKLGMAAGSTAACYRLRRGGHHRAASWLRWITFGVQATAAGLNTYHAVSRK
jgi:hypothetical protein